MRSKILLMRLAVIISLLGLWEVTARVADTAAHMVPSLPQIADELLRLLRMADFRNHASVTLFRVGVAFVLAIPSGILLGIALARATDTRNLLKPAVYFVMSVPQSVFLPLFILVFGIGTTQKVVFGLTHALFVIAMNVSAAIRTVPNSYLLAARSFGASRTQLYWIFYLPAMLPFLLTGLRLGLIFTVIGVLLAEMYASRDGIGMLIFSWGEAVRTKEMLACVLLTSVVTIVVNELLRLPERRMDEWRLREATR
jgi:ABC-type nitrate/sulfonate/bicarbonate transport system permease component